MSSVVQIPAIGVFNAIQRGSAANLFFFSYHGGLLLIALPANSDHGITSKPACIVIHADCANRWSWGQLSIQTLRHRFVRSA